MSFKDFEYRVYAIKDRIGIAALDMANIQKIAKALNGSQCNTRILYDVSAPMREVWNLSDFGFAYEVTKAVHSRYLRIRALKRLLSITKNSVVIKQIDKYLADDKKWDSDIVDKLSADIKILTGEIHSFGGSLAGVKKTENAA